MTTCNTEYLHPETHPDLPCITAIRMSCNIPLVFERFKYLDNYYIDGGLADNFPVLYGEKIGNKIIALHLQVDANSVKDEPADGMLIYFIRLLQIPILQATKYKLDAINKEKTTVISIKSGNLRNMLEFRIKSTEQLEMFSMGYTYVKEYMTNTV
jgi:predicted acylesterase/phospholipase RssA